MFFFDTCNAVAAREDWKPKYWWLGQRHLGLSLTLCWIDYLRLPNDFSGFYKRSINAGTWKSTITNHIQDVVFDGATLQCQNSIQDGSALVVNILVFNLRVQLQHCTYQRKTLLFALIKVSTFIWKREISGLSSPLIAWLWKDLSFHEFWCMIINLIHLLFVFQNQ